MVETALVSLLMEGGISHKRAVCFERWVDDKCSAGLSSDDVADAILQCIEKRVNSVERQRDDAWGQLELWKEAYANVSGQRREEAPFP